MFGFRNDVTSDVIVCAKSMFYQQYEYACISGTDSRIGVKISDVVCFIAKADRIYVSYLESVRYCLISNTRKYFGVL